MTVNDLEQYLRSLGWNVENLQGDDGNTYVVVRGYQVPSGGLAGRECDLAIQRTSAVPFVLPPAIHTQPSLVKMGTYNTQQSGIGPEWQYWSRRLSVKPSPQVIVAHIATVFDEVVSGE